MPAQGGVAVTALAESHVVPDGQVSVPEGGRQLPCEVHLAGPGDAVVHLLQQDDVRLVALEDADDPLGTEAAVDTDRAVDVVRQHAEAHQALERAVCGEWDGELADAGRRHRRAPPRGAGE